MGHPPRSRPTSGLICCWGFHCEEASAKELLEHSAPLATAAWLSQSDFHPQHSEVLSRAWTAGLPPSETATQHMTKTACPSELSGLNQPQALDLKPLERLRLATRQKDCVPSFLCLLGLPVMYPRNMSHINMKLFTRFSSTLNPYPKGPST